MSYTIGNNYVSSEIKVYPILAAGPLATAGNPAWVESSLVEVVPINTITSNFCLIGLTSFIAPLATADTRVQGIYNIYSSSVLIASIPFDFYIDSALGHCMEQVIPILPGIRIAANSQIRVSVACSIASMVFGGFKIQYVEELETYTTSLVKSYPYLATGVNITSSVTAWTWPASWTELVPANAITNVIDINAITCIEPVAEGTSLDVTYQGVIQIGKGTAGAEVSIISIPVTFLIDTKAEHIPFKMIFTLPIPVRVAANTRIAIRVTDSLAGALTWGPIKIQYIKGVYASTETVTATATGVPVSVRLAARLRSVTSTAIGTPVITRLVDRLRSVVATAIGIAVSVEEFAAGIKTYFETVVASAVGVAVSSRLVTGFRTIVATAVDIPAVSRFASLSRSGAATSVGIPISVRSVSAHRGVTAIAISIPLVARLVSRFRAVIATAVEISVVSRFLNSTRTVIAVVVTVPISNRRVSALRSGVNIAVGSPVVSRLLGYKRIVVAVSVGISVINRLLNSTRTVIATATGIVSSIEHVVSGAVKEYFETVTAIAVGVSTVSRSFHISRAVVATAIGEIISSRLVSHPRSVIALAVGKVTIDRALSLARTVTAIAVGTPLISRLLDARRSVIAIATGVTIGLTHSLMQYYHTVNALAVGLPTSLERLFLSATKIRTVSIRFLSKRVVIHEFPEKTVEIQDSGTAEVI